jgi:hypothetical protein
MGNYRVLEVRERAALKLENIAIVDGYVASRQMREGGAGILNRGRLNLHHVEITRNRTDIAVGAGIYNAPAATLTITDTQIRRNFSDGGMGAGLYNAGDAHIAGSSVSHNTIYSLHEKQVTAEFGAGIFNDRMLTIVDSDISENSAPNAAGIFNSGDMRLEDSTLTYNNTRTTIGCTGDGAGIFNAGTANLIGVMLRHNRAGKWAGGIDNQGVMTIADSRIEENAACVGGGGIFNAFERANLTITNSIIARNSSEQRPERNNGLYNLISVDDVPGKVHAPHNYWGSSDGPGGEGPGSGDGISGVTRETYIPWLEQPPDWARE